MKMWNFTRSRYTAGNICLVMFIAFLFTVLVTPMAMVGNAEAAMVETGNDKVTAYEGVNDSDTYEFLVQLAVSDPLTAFSAIRVDFINPDDGSILSINGEDFTKSAGAEVDGVTGFVYSLVYDIPEDFNLSAASQVYGKVYVDEGHLYDFILTVPVPPDEPEGGDGGSSSGGGGNKTTPTGSSSTVEKSAADFVGTNSQEVTFSNGGVNFVIPAGALDVQELADLFKLDPNTKVNFVVTEVTAASVGLAEKMGKSEWANLKSVGKIFSFEILAKSGDKEVKITNFKTKITVGIPYIDADLGDLKAETLGGFRITGSGLVALGGEVNKDTKFVSFATESFSDYTLMAKTAAFADIMNHWAKGDIQLLADKGIVKGLSSNLFGPDNNITRAEFATLLVKALALTEVKPAAGTFKDVASSAWYYGTVETAAANGLVAGFDGKFNPNGKITRQEMAVMIAKALKAGGKTVTLSAAEVSQLLTKFSDTPQISAWAQDSVAVAVKEGIIAGRTATTFAGKANATRAEGTVMIKQDLSSLGKL